MKMNPIPLWAPLTSALVALAFGILPYATISHAGVLPPWLRESPWPMELLAVLATAAALVLTVAAFRQRRLRLISTISALVALGSTTLFALFLHVVSYELPPAPDQLRVGTQAPAFVLPDANGESVALESVHGSPTLLIFYRGAWCFLCRSELATLAQRVGDFEEAGVDIVAISSDEREPLVEMQQALALPFPLLSDPEEQVIRQYGLLHSDGKDVGEDIARPAVLLLDSEGVIRWATFTDNMRVGPSPEALLQAAKDMR